MLKRLVLAALLASALGACASTSEHHSVRIDASSAEAAEASYQAMMKGRSEEQQQKLALAVLVLNMEGVASAYEAARNPELQSPSIVRIRQLVAGMTAEEIWKRAAQSPSIRIESTRQ